VTVIFYHKTRISEEEPPLFIVIEAVTHTTLLANTSKAFTCFIKRKILREGRDVVIIYLTGVWRRELK
jgi:hypothetical protein